MWWIFVGIAVLLALWVCLVAPKRADKNRRAALKGYAYAHRGLYEADQSVPENSLEAFRRAVEAGYGIELDLQLSADGQVVVFHDDKLFRVCGVDQRVDAYRYEELREFKLFDSAEHIPLFSDVLQIVAAKVPLIVELKAGGEWRALCEKACAMLAAYDGPYCVESFHPSLVRWFCANAPDVLRGQLSEAYRYSSRHVGGAAAFVMSRLLTNVWTRPHFIAYRIGPKCLSARFAEALGAIKVCWTSREPREHAGLAAKNDMVIFEHYRP